MHYMIRHGTHRLPKRVGLIASRTYSEYTREYSVSLWNYSAPLSCRVITAVDKDRSLTSIESSCDRVTPAVVQGCQLNTEKSHE